MKKIFSFFSALLFCMLMFNTSAQYMDDPEIDDQNRVTFRVNAPNARVVKVVSWTDEEAMGAMEYTLNQGEDSIWTVTTNPCRPGFHYYHLDIDGFLCADPNSQVYFGWAKWSSGLEVPGEGLDFYLPRDTPRGQVITHWYNSKITGKLRKCLVYTPPDYNEDINRRYPVIYLQHGSGESQLGWTMQGKVNFIMDNLIAKGKAKPMLIVMDNGYARPPESTINNSWQRGESRFEQNMLEDLIPEIDSKFRTIPERESRAVAGLSMGAGQAQRVGFGNLETFASIGAFSGGSRNFNVNTSYSGVFKDADEFNSKVKLYWIGCGNLDGAYEGAKNLHNKLNEHGIRHVFHEMHGSHEWQVWRHHIYEFAQKVFN